MCSRQPRFVCPWLDLQGLYRYHSSCVVVSKLAPRVPPRLWSPRDLRAQYVSSMKSALTSCLAMHRVRQATMHNGRHATYVGKRCTRSVVALPMTQAGSALFAGQFSTTFVQDAMKRFRTAMDGSVKCAVGCSTPRYVPPQLRIIAFYAGMCGSQSLSSVVVAMMHKAPASSSLTRAGRLSAKPPTSRLKAHCRERYKDEGTRKASFSLGWLIQRLCTASGSLHGDPEV